MKHAKSGARRDVQMAPSASEKCSFCEIVAGQTDSVRVFDDENTLAFLDHRPLFPGHCLLITKQHIRTLADFPPPLVEPVFLNVRMLAMAVQNAMEADGSFIAINNIVSQSVPHFHVHVVPRRKGDGLRGFMWPRHKYATAEEAQGVGDAIRQEITRLRAAKT